MRMSTLFGRTLRETPADAEMVSHQLLLRAGMIRSLGAGIYSYLPLGYRVKAKVEAILRREMDAIGAQEMLMPVVHPAEVWQASGRWHSVDETLLRFQDRSAHDMVLAMTHEEVIAHLLEREVESYRQLPAVVYHIQVKFRDERRPRGGLVRVREFTMKDAYSVHADVEDLETFYPTMLRAYEDIFQGCALDPIAVEADSGMMGGSTSHEFVLLNAEGEDTIVLCTSCDYAANAERAQMDKRLSRPSHGPEEVREVATPGCKTIEDVARYLGVPTEETLKAVFFRTEEPEPRLVFAVIRGDLEVNEVKLSHVVGDVPLRPAEESEIRAVGAVPGYASPIGVRGAVVIADDSVTLGGHFVVGANREGYHLTGVQYGRDLGADVVTDIALARAGDACPRCAGALRVERGIELGHCFKLGSRYTAARGITYLDADGDEHPIVMGSYGIGVDRLVAAIVEEHHDEHGIRWPVSVAPYPVHLVSLAREGEEQERAEALYAALGAEGIDVLYDDRVGPSAGVKFNDADLIGCPLRLTVSRRSLSKGGIEAKWRDEDERVVIPADEVVAYLHEGLATRT
ncbi:MAG: proline--tRNA ligase [Anaerolineae bacterium]